ncbi:hypothetical protein MCAMS1_00497 [biofilm metagenome]
MKIGLLALTWLFLSTSLLNGCAEVHPWERGNLAKPQMALEPNPMQSALRVHNYGSREAAASGNSTQGGGCGCY